MGWLKPKISTFEASIERDDRGRIVQIDTIKLSAKEIKEMEKLEKKCTEGERGVKAFTSGVSDFLKGKGDSKYDRYTKVIREAAKKNDHRGEMPSAPIHPSYQKSLIQKGKIQPSAKDALHIKNTDPKLYQQILQREAKRQGLL